MEATTGILDALTENLTVSVYVKIGSLVPRLVSGGNPRTAHIRGKLNLVSGIFKWLKTLSTNCKDM